MGLEGNHTYCKKFCFKILFDSLKISISRNLFGNKDRKDTNIFWPVGGYVLRSCDLTEFVCENESLVFNKITTLYPHAQGQMVVLGKPERQLEKQIELLKERWLKAQLFLRSVK